MKAAIENVESPTNEMIKPQDETLLKSLISKNTTCKSVDQCLSSLDSSLKLLCQDIRNLSIAFKNLKSQSRIVYLVQSPEVHEITNYPKQPRAEVEVLWFTFKSADNQKSDLHLPKSTFNEGRNSLLRLALGLEYNQGYSLFVFHR